ncbi:MAG: hypothetical protein ABJN69_04310 [Hellea sp.]
MQLRLIIENTPSDELAPMPQYPSADFIDAALRTAKHSKSKTRSAILADVCDVLSCHAEDLSFMFEHQAVPTQNRPVFELELPDYRMSLSDIYKVAAE